MADGCPEFARRRPPLRFLITVEIMTGRFPIEDVTPSVSCGRYPSKAVVGELVPISAVSYREGHHALGVNVVWKGPHGAAEPFTRLVPGEPGLDRWHGVIKPDRVGRWTFTVEAFDDPYLTWRNAVTKKIGAGQGLEDLANDLAEGADVLDLAAKIVPYGDEERVRAAAAAMRDENRSLFSRVSPALELEKLLWQNPVRHLVTTTRSYAIWVDRQRALYSSWYEFFPRSEGAEIGPDATPIRHGTFATAAKRIPAVAAMGFDVLYLPPIHPIGKINRKGRNNTLVAREGIDVGSPWAIGSDEGGHDAIHPQLGDLADFREFIAVARDNGMEVAMDLALQAAPDHPWVKSNPEWFTTRADGTIAYAENPPKKYQDIYPINFDNDPRGLREEVLRIVLHWVENGVKIFRVDNPHTKTLTFWQWLISKVKAVDPDVLFLAEAFTRLSHDERARQDRLHPVIHVLHLAHHGLGDAGVPGPAQGLDRLDAPQLLAQHPPDILHESLQHGGPPMFKIRTVLASMLSPSWGMYSGLELFEHVNRPGAEEYIDNEKFELKPRDWARRRAVRSDAGALHHQAERHPA
nr:DUF3416 domain-containing protein [Actinoplanes digitatis]